MNSRRLPHILPLGLALAGHLFNAHGWEPGNLAPNALGTPGQPLRLNTQDRQDVVAFYQCVYEASEPANHDTMGWTGSINGCDPGTTSQSFRDAVQRRVNYYRAMAGVPGDIVFTDTLNRQAQAAALIMAANRKLSHDPEGTWGQGGCWSADAQAGASSGNLHLGRTGADAINAYMLDPGGNNQEVGHRRWLLYTPTTVMGTGDIPGKGPAPYNAPGDHPPTNCLVVVDFDNVRPPQETFVAWPPAGFVPESQVYDRWSLHFNAYRGNVATFGEAQVSMRFVDSQESIPLALEHRDAGPGSAGDPAIVWVPDWSGHGGRPPLERAIEVTVSQITPGNSVAPASTSYVVTPIDPHVIIEPLELTGPAHPPSSGARYTFTPLSGNANPVYEVGVAVIEETDWTEGAEDTASPRITNHTTTSSPLQRKITSVFGSPGPYEGQHAFHLTFPTLTESEQWFEIDRTVVIEEDSTLTFFQLFRFSTATSRLSAEISVDGGSWTEVWGKNGNGIASTDGWLKQWTREEIDLSAHAGRALRVRFRYAGSQSMYAGEEEILGAFIDAVSIDDAALLGSDTITRLSAGAHQFALNDSTAGTDLREGQSLLLRMRPVLGCKTFPFGRALEVEVGEPAEEGFDAWMDAYHPTLANKDFDADPDGDGIPNGAEFALGLDPTKADLAPGLRRSTNGSWEVAFDPESLPYDTESVTYRLEASVDLQSWETLDPLEGLSGLVFQIPSGRQGHIRWAISERP